jgi:hypothetical protein
VLERILLDESGKLRPQFATVDDAGEHRNGNHLSALRQEGLERDFGQGSHQQHQIADDMATFSESTGSPPPGSRSQKRQRTNEMHPNLCEDDDSEHSLPPSDLLDAIIDIHFKTVHHWVPILHETRFRAKLANPDERNRLAVLLHSLVAISIRYVDLDRFDLGRVHVERQIRTSRRVVTLHAMQSLTVDNLQALIFLAFDYVSCQKSSAL